MNKIWGEKHLDFSFLAQQCIHLLTLIQFRVARGELWSIPAVVGREPCMSWTGGRSIPGLRLRNSAVVKFGPFRCEAVCFSPIK